MKKVLLYTFLITFIAMAVSCNSDRSSEQTSQNPDPAYVENRDPATNEATSASDLNSGNEGRIADNGTTGQEVTKPAATGTRPQNTQSAATNTSSQPKSNTTNENASTQKTSTIPEDVVIGNEVGNDLGDFESYDQDSVIRRLSDSRGKLTMMVLWNSKCGHCVTENEKYREVYNQYHDKQFVNGDGFEIYSIGLDKVRETWVEALEEKQYPWKYNVYVLDSWKDRDIRFFGIKNLPGTFLIDENGIVLAKKFTGEELVTLLEGYLEK